MTTDQNKKFKDGYSIEGKEIPRKQIWYHKNKKYFCDKWKYRYDRWESDEYDNLLNYVQDYIQIEINTLLEDWEDIKIPKINSCLINKYRDGNDSIKPHSESEISFGECPTIVNLSIGETRELKIKKKGYKDKFSINLKNNSILIMAGGSQKYFTHEIPKDYSNNERYSLTFREHIQ